MNINKSMNFNPKITLKNFGIAILILILLGLGYWYFYQKYETKMIKLDACLKSCPNMISTPVEARECRYKCSEKYGVSIEKFNEWKSE